MTAVRKMKNVKEFDTKDAVVAAIPITDMVIDDYQGHVNKSLVDKMAAKWDSSAAGAVILNMREDNTYAVLDGQHRVLAAKKVGVTELNALVFIGKSREEEAKLFVQLNTKHNVSSIDRFNANLFAGGRREREIRLALKEVGLEIGRGTGKKTPDIVSSVGALVNVYNKFGLAALKTVVGTLTSAYHDFADRHKAYSQPGIVGTTQFFYRYPEADVARVIQKMRTKAPTAIMAMGEAKLDVHSDVWQGWARMLVDLYNEGLKRANQLDPTRMFKKVYTPAGLQVVKSEERREQMRRISNNLTEEQKRKRNDALLRAQEASRQKHAARLKAKEQADMILNAKGPLRGRALAAAAKTTSK